MEELLDRITVDPDILVGKPAIRGTRIPVYLIVEFVANGMSAQEILKEYPRLKEDDIKAALLYSSETWLKAKSRLLCNKFTYRCKYLQV